MKNADKLIFVINFMWNLVFLLDKVLIFPVFLKFMLRGIKEIFIQLFFISIKFRVWLFQLRKQQKPKC